MVALLPHILPYIQIILSVLLITAILVQQSAAGLGATFGGDGFSVGNHTRRGFEKTIFRITIVLATLFAISALVALFIH